MSTSAPVKGWPEGDQAIDTAMAWLQQKYVELNSPPFVVDSEWNRLEGEVNDVYAGGDRALLKQALQTWARHVIAQMRHAAAGSPATADKLERGT